MCKSVLVSWLLLAQNLKYYPAKWLPKGKHNGYRPANANPMLGQAMLLPFSDFLGNVKAHSIGRNTEYWLFWPSPGTLTLFLVLLIYLLVGWIKNKGIKLGLSSIVDSETAEKEEYIYFQGIKAMVPQYPTVFYIRILSDLSFKT